MVKSFTCKLFTIEEWHCTHRKKCQIIYIYLHVLIRFSKRILNLRCYTGVIYGIVILPFPDFAISFSRKWRGDLLPSEIAKSIPGRCAMFWNAMGGGGLCMLLSVQGNLGMRIVSWNETIQYTICMLLLLDDNRTKRQGSLWRYRL